MLKLRKQVLLSLKKTRTKNKLNKVAKLASVVLNTGFFKNEKISQKKVDYFVALCENIEDDVLVTREHPIR